MSIKQLTLNEKRIIYLKGFLKKLVDTRIITNKANEWVDIGALIPGNYKENVNQIYGKPSDENYEDVEWLLCKFLFLLTIAEYAIFERQNAGILGFDMPDIEGDNLIVFIKNTKNKIELYFKNDFKIFWNADSKNKKIIWNEYEPVETKSIMDNLKNVPEKKAFNIASLLKPHINENEMIGFINKIHSDFEEMFPSNMSNLNKIDESIYKNTWSLSKQIINSVKAAKGHNGKSQLSVRDIAHNFALNASLIEKLIVINKNNENKKEKNE